MRDISEYDKSEYKKYRITYRMKPNWGGHIGSLICEYPNKTYARMFGTEFLNPHTILKIEEVVE